MSTPNSSPSDFGREHELQQIQEALQGLRFGSLHIVVQDGLVIQIDRTEKRRLRVPASVTKTDRENC